MQILCDQTKMLAVLINCRLSSGVLLCGAAFFRGGLSGAIEVFDSSHKFTIKVPESVANIATSQVFSNANDNLEIELCNQQLPEK